jgi:hypothetical protein
LKKKVYISLLSLFFPIIVFGQDTIPAIKDNLPETLEKEVIPIDSLLAGEPDITQDLPIMSGSIMTVDSSKSVNYWRITERTGEIFPVRPDTFLTDYFNRTNVEGQGLSVAYPGNLGLPSESRVFFDREDRSEFMFGDAYWAYAKRPDNFHFINTKIPYSNLSYQTAGSRQNKEERLQALLALNFNRQLNIGFNVDYLYARGFYNSQASKHLEWVLFGNYISGKHQAHLFINPEDYISGENGGLADDRWITHPEEVDNRNARSKDYPTKIDKTWNRMKGTRYYLNYHYNLGFDRKTEEKDEEGNEIKQFIPVSGIIYTFDYTNRNRLFYTNDSASVNRFYNYVDFFNPDQLREKRMLRDSTSYSSMRNTVGLSLREGFSKWAKFDLTAFITQDIRNFTLMDTTLKNMPDTIVFDAFKNKQYATYIGGELIKRTGKILTYNAQGNLGILGYNLGDFDISGNIETRIPFLHDTASIIANGYIKNLSPTFYENNYHSQYFWWNNDFGKVKKVYFGGAVTIPHTHSRFTLGVENISNYIYFDETGYPKQDGGNIQILAAGLEQDFHLRALHWNNRLVYQTSSAQNTIPLPDLTAYSSLFLQIVIAKVLTIQMGVNAHYWTKYYSPVYDPATQQFRLQHDSKVGEYPLLNGFINAHLKQTRFFIEYYNAGSMFLSPAEYFSIPHYPVNPTVLKLGLSIDFHN